jgi:hypothetical protein
MVTVPCWFAAVVVHHVLYGALMLSIIAWKVQHKAYACLARGHFKPGMTRLLLGGCWSQIIGKNKDTLYVLLIVLQELDTCVNDINDVLQEVREAAHQLSQQLAETTD